LDSEIKKKTLQREVGLRSTKWMDHLRTEGAPMNLVLLSIMDVGGLISFASTAIFLFTVDISG
jgi:hypothetical protein